MRRKNFVAFRYWRDTDVTMSELFFKAKGRERIAHYGKCGGTEVACKRRSDLLFLLDSDDKWGLKGSNA